MLWATKIAINMMAKRRASFCLLETDSRTMRSIICPPRNSFSVRAFGRDQTAGFHAPGCEHPQCPYSGLIVCLIASMTSGNSLFVLEYCLICTLPHLGSQQKIPNRKLVLSRLGSQRKIPKSQQKSSHLSEMRRKALTKEVLLGLERLAHDSLRIGVRLCKEETERLEG